MCCMRPLYSSACLYAYWLARVSCRQIGTVHRKKKLCKEMEICPSFLCPACPAIFLLYLPPTLALQSVRMVVLLCSPSPCCSQAVSPRGGEETLVGSHGPRHHIPLRCCPPSAFVVLLLLPHPPPSPLPHPLHTLYEALLSITA